jgi:hypothetical protein
MRNCTPIGSVMLLTTKLMLDWLKETEMATRLEAAIARVIAEGKVRPTAAGRLWRGRLRGFRPEGPTSAGRTFCRLRMRPLAIRIPIDFDHANSLRIAIDFLNHTAANFDYERFHTMVLSPTHSEIHVI